MHSSIAGHRVSSAPKPFHRLGLLYRCINVRMSTYRAMQPVRISCNPDMGPSMDLSTMRRMLASCRTYKEMAMEITAALDAYEAIKSNAVDGGACSVLASAASSAAQACSAMGIIQANAGNHLDALDCFQQSERIARAHGSTADIQLAHHGLATSLHNLGRLEAALQVWDSMMNTLDQDTEQFALACRGAATSSVEASQPERVLQLMSITFDHFIHYYGADSPEMMHVLEVMGIAKWMTAEVEGSGSLDSALACIQQVLALRALHQGNQSAEYLATLRNLAHLLMHMRQYRQSELVWHELVTTHSMKLGSAHAECLHALVGLADATADPEAATHVYGVAAQQLDTAGQARAASGLHDGELALLAHRIHTGVAQCKAGETRRGGPWSPANIPPLSITATPTVLIKQPASAC